MLKISPLAVGGSVLILVVAVTAGVLYTQQSAQIKQLAEGVANLRTELLRQSVSTPKSEAKVETVVPASPTQALTASKFYVTCYTEPASIEYDTILKCIDGSGATVTALTSINTMLGSPDNQATTVFLVPGTDLVYISYHIVESDADAFGQHVVYNLKTAAKSRVDLASLPGVIEWLLPDYHLSPDSRHAVIAGASKGPGDVSLDIKHFFVVDLVQQKVVATITAPSGTSFTASMGFRELNPSINWRGADMIGYTLYAPPITQKDKMGNPEDVPGTYLREETYKLQ